MVKNKPNINKWLPVQQRDFKARCAMSEYVTIRLKITLLDLATNCLYWACFLPFKFPKSRKYRSFIIYFSIIAVIIAVAVVSYIEWNNDNEKWRYGLHQLHEGDVKIIKWTYDGSQIDLNIYNPTDKWVKTIDIEYIAGESPGYKDKKIPRCADILDKIRYPFRLELDESNLLNPKSSGSYKIYTGSVLVEAQGHECQNIRIIDGNGYYYRKEKMSNAVDTV